MASLPVRRWIGKTLPVEESTARAFERMEVMVAAGDKRGSRIFLSCMCTVCKVLEVTEKVKEEEALELAKREAFALGTHPRLGAR